MTNLELEKEIKMMKISIVVSAAIVGATVGCVGGRVMRHRKNKTLPGNVEAGVLGTAIIIGTVATTNAIVGIGYLKITNQL